MDKESLVKNYNDVLEEIRKYDKDGRVKLLIATKQQTTDSINCLVEAGADLIGENKVNELLEKYEGYDKRAEVHFIGTLQSNKVKYIVDKVTLIHSVYKSSQLEEISKRAGNIGKVMDILIEVNSGKEENKGGIFPEDVAEFCTFARGIPNVRVRGLMTMAPKCQSRDEYLKYFGLTKELFDRLFANEEDAILSMGMSDSYIYAIEAGANLVRVGSKIFGERKY